MLTLDQLKANYKDHLDKIRKGTVFLRTTKTGGGTVERTLSASLNASNYHYESINLQTENVKKRNGNLLKIKNFESYFSFYLVRNPFSKVMSGIEFLSRAKEADSVTGFLRQINLLDIFNVKDCSEFEERYDFKKLTPGLSEYASERGFYRHVLMRQMDMLEISPSPPTVIIETPQINDFFDFLGKVYTDLDIPNNISAETSSRTQKNKNADRYKEMIENTPGLEAAIYNRFKEDFEKIGPYFSWPKHLHNGI